MAFSIFPKKIDFFRLFLYLLFGGASLFLYFILDKGEPIPLALVYAMVSVGFSPIPTALLCALPAIFSLDLFQILLLLGQALLVAFGQFLEQLPDDGRPVFLYGFLDRLDAATDISPLLDRLASLGRQVFIAVCSDYQASHNLIHMTETEDSYVKS